MARNYWTVGELMSRGVVTIGMDDTLLTARSIFHSREFHHLIVLDNGKPVGVISDRDLLRNLSPFVNVPLSEQSRDRDTLKRKVHQIMTRKLIVIQSDCPAAAAAELMLKQRVSCLPVVNDKGNVIGIISVYDLLHWIVENQPLKQPAAVNAW